MTAERVETSRTSANPAATGARGRGARGNPPGRPTQDELERRKARVLKVATGLFIAQGFAATSLVEIAKGAGVATRTVYQHFGDKDALFRSVMFAREPAPAFARPRIAAGDDLTEAMTLVARYICEVTFRPGALDRIRLAIAESPRFPEMIRQLMEDSYTRFRADVRGLLEDAVAQGLVRDADPAASADLFIQLVIGDAPLMAVCGWRAPIPTPEQLRQKAALFIAGHWGVEGG